MSVTRYIASTPAHQDNLLIRLAKMFFSPQSKQPPYHLPETRGGNSRRDTDDWKMKLNCTPNQGPINKTHDPKPFIQDSPWFLLYKTSCLQTIEEFRLLIASFPVLLGGTIQDKRANLSPVQRPVPGLIDSLGTRVGKNSILTRLVSILDCKLHEWQRIKLETNKTPITQCLLSHFLNTIALLNVNYNQMNFLVVILHFWHCWF